MMPDWVADGLVGLAGGFIFAFTTIRSALCEGDKPPTLRERNAAWAQFANYMVTAPFFAAVITPAAVAHFGSGPHSWMTWPMVAAFIGVSANYIWPLALKAYGYVIDRWIRGGSK
ncbi:MAG: hypothetical protein ACYDD1_18825 [Caulobacteraceae bacterium]